MTTTEIRPYRVQIPQADLDDLHDRLRRTRWASEIEGADWDYGVPVVHVRSLVDRWLTTFDWRAFEARLNGYPQFTTVIDGQTIHFLHVRSSRPGALPLILTHGWPGSVAEWLDVIGPLTDPTAYGHLDAPTFHLVIPSLPGFGFSGPTADRGWHTTRIAALWIELMRRLGYDRYGAVGNDWGAEIAPQMGRAAPDAVLGVHVTQMYPDLQADDLDPDVAEESAAIEGLAWFHAHMDAYDHVQSQQPQSLAHALTDSPAGLLGWHSLVFRDSADADFVLTNVAIYWLTGTVASAMRIYYENAALSDRFAPTTVPIGLARFADDAPALRRHAERFHRRIVSWHAYDVGGHWAAHQVPDVFVEDLRAFFADVLAAPERDRTQ